MYTSINLWAVLVSAIASMVIGGIWHGPLFGKKFSELMGFNKLSQEERQKMMDGTKWNYVLQFIASLVMFFVLAWYVDTSIHTGALGGMANAFGLWLGFVVPLSFSAALWGGKMGIFWINVGNMLLTLLVAGAIIGAWH